MECGTGWSAGESLLSSAGAPKTVHRVPWITETVQGRVPFSSLSLRSSSRASILRYGSFSSPKLRIQPEQARMRPSQYWSMLCAATSSASLLLSDKKVSRFFGALSAELTSLPFRSSYRCCRIYITRRNGEDNLHSPARGLESRVGAGAAYGFKTVGDEGEGGEGKGVGG